MKNSVMVKYQTKLDINKFTGIKSEMNKLTMLMVLSAVLFSAIQVYAGGFELPGPLQEEVHSYTAQDTVPIKDRFGDFLNDQSNNPFDLNTSLIKQEVEYDPETGNYILTEKIGDEFYRMPTYMTFEEYMDWKAKEQQQSFFDKMAGVESGSRSRSGKIDPISNINIERNLVDRLFGGNGITIKPKGNIDITLLGFYQKTSNPSIPLRNQVQWGPDFDMDIKMSVDGNIGDKMNLGFNFNTASTFDFDDKIKLEYDSEQWSEDEIIKKVEAGNVSLPLRSTLIQGGQNLFGLKLETQFGKLKLTTIASQKNSTQEELTIESGGLAQEFEIRPDEYDQNRHFFISNFNRNSYESALTNLPQITTPFRVTKMQVWITNDRNETDGLRNIIALADLGVGDEDYMTNPDAIDPSLTANDANFIDYTGTNVLPDNRVNNLYDEIVNDEAARDQTTAATVLATKYGLTQTKDFEVLKARQLRPQEYTFHPELGFISLNIRLRPNQVLAVTYQYSYSYNGSEVYQVGEMANDVSFEVPPKNLFARLLKNTTQNVDEPNWDLMMKNVYSIGGSQLDRETFKFDIFYEDNSDGSLKRYIPRQGFFNKPLLDVFNLDKLNIYNDPQQDGIFDFVEGVTIIPRTGSIIFPVLEPFGSSLEDLLGEDLAMEFAYQDLYDKTLFQAQERLERNRFVMMGEFKSSVSSEISLGAWNIPEGSVTVRAGSQTLQPGIDYEINYGIGQIRIINDAYLQQGVPIRVSYEDNSLFSLNQKAMLGTRADYAFNKNLNLGATYMHLFERPYTQKVNVGDDPINNRIYGLDVNYTNEVPWITRSLDRLPFYSTKAPSSINFNAEVAALRPGHARAINGGEDGDGIIMLDDFEGASSSIPLGIQTNQWIMASVPGGKGLMFPEAELANDLRYGYNRAMLNWYIMERRSGIRNSTDQNDPYTRPIDLTELFPNKVVQPGTFSDILTFDMTYYPEERGPYNFDPPAGSDVSAGSFWDNETKKVKLKEPESRWAGIMRFLNNTNFEQANVEFIEFWMLNPYINSRAELNHLPDEAGSLVFNLGNVSEDVLRDNLQYYENAIPVASTATLPIQQTVWGKVPLVTPRVNGFDQNNRDDQDIGFDGLTDDEERANFRTYIEAIEADNPLAEVRNDPANDNFTFFNDQTVFNDASSLWERYYRFNGPEGNAPDPNATQFERGNPLPDTEDMNNNRSLDQGESYWEYEVKLFNQNGELDEDAAEYVTETRNLGANGDEKWYRFRIPLSDGQSVGGIQGFQAIQFIRMYLKGFSTQKTFRMADLQLIRNQWRRFVPNCTSDGSNPVDFSVDKVSIEENSSRTPFNYVLPRGITRETVFTSYAQLPQDERSIALEFKNLKNEGEFFCEASIIKLTQVDLRVFKRLQMFVHAESPDIIADGDLSLFIRIGKDFSENFYEYVIPLKLSNLTDPGNVGNPDSIWLKDNMLDIPLSIFTDIKQLRNLDGEFNEIFPAQILDQPERQAYIKGNPSLGYIKGLQIGIRNSSTSNAPLEGTVWVNELRMSGLDERGGVAGLARMDVQLADIGNLTLSGAFNTIGWGALDQKLDARSKESVVEYDVAANLEMGKFLPKWSRLSLPVYAQFANTTRTPQFDPYDLDLTVKQKLESLPDQREEILDLAVEQTTIKTFTVNNVRRQRKSDNTKKPKPWDISNFSASYAITQIQSKDPIIESDLTNDQRGSLDYAYSRSVNYIEPFKAIKNKNLKFISAINFNLFPNSFTFNTQLKKYDNVRKYRLPVEFDYRFFDQRFTWDRRYNLQWDFTKSLNLSFSADNLGLVDELRQVGLADNARIVDERGDVIGEVDEVSNREIADYRNDNIRDFGRTKTYSHNININYNVPLKNIPLLDFTTLKAQYNADFYWEAASLNVDSLGNVIQNGQNRQLNFNMDFEKLYKKSKYLKKIDGGNSSSSRRSTARSRTKSTKNDTKADDKGDKKKDKKEREVSMAEKIIIRPLLLLRDFRFTYKEDFSTTVPGFSNQTNILGMNQDFTAPGWDFVSGIQPNIDPTNSSNWLYQGADKDWFSTSRFLNQQINQSNQQNFEAKIELEPFKDFEIDINFRKRYSNNHLEEFKNTTNAANPVFQQIALNDIGSFEVTYFSMNTFFNDDFQALFQSFEDSRATISERLADRAVRAGAANAGDPHDIDEGYQYGYGRQSDAVLVPAFIATYTGIDPGLVDLDFVTTLSAWNYIPAPNWDLNYNGLSKLDFFKDIFSSFSIKHGYKSVMRVNNFNSDPVYNNLITQGSNTAIYEELEQQSANYFSRIEIPQLTISESFAPLIGIDIKTKSDMNLNFEYRKTRELGMNFNGKELVESNTEEIIFGFGYTFQNVDIPFLTGSGKNKKTRSKDEKKPLLQLGGDSGKITDTRGRELLVNVDFSFRDDVVANYTIDLDGDAEKTRGSQSLRINPSMEYDVNQNLALRLFFDYSRTIPVVLTSFPLTNAQGGITLRFKLN